MDGESRRPERNETDIKPPGENTGNSEEIPEEIDSDDLTGPGPRPLIDIAKENGGDAGASEGSASESSDSLGKDNVPSDSVPESGRDQGTGEKYVKSTGVAADGGNFDATQPGAGREADREYSHPAVANFFDLDKTNITMPIRANGREGTETVRRQSAK